MRFLVFMMLCPVTAVATALRFPAPDSYLLGLASLMLFYVSCREYAERETLLMRERVAAFRDEAGDRAVELQRKKAEVELLTEENRRLQEELGDIRGKLSGDEDAELELITEKALQAAREEEEEQDRE